MDSVQAIQSFVETHPGHRDAAVLARLVQALRDEQEFDLGTLYELDFANFDLGVRLLHDWRLQRYYLGSARACQLPAA